MRKLPDDKLLTIEEVSKLVGLSPTTIRNKRAAKKVTLRFSHNDVQAWIEKRKEAAHRKRAATAARKRPNQRTQTRSNLRLIK